MNMKTKFSNFPLGKKPIKISLIILFLLIIGMVMVYSARQPTVDGDFNEWGTSLNEYLNVSHTENGTLKKGLNASFNNFNVTNKFMYSGTELNLWIMTRFVNVSWDNITYDSEIVGHVGNWTNDKPNYPLSTSLPNLTMQQINDSFKNFSQWQGIYPNVDTDNTDDLTTSGGTVAGNLVIDGNLTILGDEIIANVTTQKLNGSFLPQITNTFNIGSPTAIWAYVYATSLYGSLGWGNLTDYPTGCTNQFIRDIDDTFTCASVDSADIATNAVKDDEIDYSAVTFADITDDVGYALASSLPNVTMQQVNDSFGNWSQAQSNYYITTQIDTSFDALPNVTMQQINDSFKNFSQYLATYPNLDTDSTDDLDTAKLDNGSVVRSHNTSWVTGLISAGDSNLTYSVGAFKLAFVDLAELDNSNSAFITTAVSTLANYPLSTSLPNITMQQINDSFKNFSQWQGIYPNVDTDNTDDLDTAKLDNATIIRSGVNESWARDTINQTNFYDINVSGALNSYDLLCTNCIGGTEIAELADADISNTLTCSDVVGAEVISDAEVVNDLTIVSTKPINTTKDFNVNLKFNVTASNGNVNMAGNLTIGTFKIYIDSGGNLII